MDYLPPLVKGNRLEEFFDVKNTLNVTGLDIGGYIRISTKKDSQKTSIENQKKYILEWAGINGYNIVDFYIDVKTGAYSYLRNEMTRLINDISTGRIKGIVSKEISRTSRDILDIIELKRSLVAQGAFFISIKEGYDSRTDDDEFLLVIHAGLAQKERKTTSSRVKITQLIKAKEGKTNVANPAFGYKLSEDGQHLVVNPEQAEVYKLIVDRFLEGWGRLKICKYLNSQGVKTSRGGNNWTTNSIINILINPVYLGVNMYNVTVTVRDSSGKAKRRVRPQEQWIVREDTHPALISRDKFDRIQQLVLDRKEKDNKEWSCTKKYLLSGLLYCSSCGSRLYGGKIPKNKSKGRSKADRTDRDYYFYYFDRKITGACLNKISNYRMEIVDELVMEAIKRFFSNSDLIEEKIRQKQYIYDLKLEKEKKERETVKYKLENIKSAVKKQQLAFEADVITLEEYRSRLNELREHKSSLEKKLLLLEKKLHKFSNTEDRYSEILKKVKCYIHNINSLNYELKEEILRKIISKVIIGDNYNLSFEFTFEE
ncbi:MAG: site-specific recombinase, invertase Pin [Eubacterium sp.]|jgi:DNA invertase Pin-like site-specific DNA recombinase|nr:site-specific recombinase, invertase Pin [Eubacterium sp.]